MPKKEKRAKSDYRHNETASLDLNLIKKNADANGTSFLYALAEHTAKHALSMASSAAVTVFDYAKMSWADNTTPETKAKPATPAPKTPTKENIEAEIRRRQAETAAPDEAIRAEMEAIESKIQKRLTEKKSIDQEEKALRESETIGSGKKKLSASKAAKRLLLIEEIDNLLLQKIDTLKDLIIEHAARRVDLMFLLMIAVYKKNVVISKGSTNRQHGKGSNKAGTAACHSCLIPNPVFEELPLEQVASGGVSTLISAFSGIFAKATPAVPAPPRDPDILKGKYLRDSFNSTVALPVLVNDFDGKMEGKYQQSQAVRAALRILNLVSQGKLNPIDGISYFGKIMAEFLTAEFYRRQVEIDFQDLLDDEESEEYFPHADILYPKAFKKVCEYEQAGTLRVFDITIKAIEADGEQHLTSAVKQEYYEMVLGISGGAQHYAKGYLPEKLEGLSSWVLRDDIEAAILTKQEEILSNDSEFEARLRK